MCNPSSGAEGYSFIMRSDGLIISHEDANLVGRTVVYSNIYSTKNAPAYNVTTLDGQKSIIVTTQAETLNERYNFDCCIISVLDYDYYFGTFDRVVIIVIAVSFIMLAVAVVLAVSMAHKITQPITSLSESINATAEPTKEHVSVLPEGDELKQLEYNYDRMLDRIYDLVEKNKRDMQLQRKLELDSLQMQINPHFLYNTLDAISWMAKIKKQPEIDKLVMNLAKFFRLSLHKGDKFITVDEELQIVKHYLEIDKIRFPDRVSVHYEIDESVLQYKTLKLILQPIVENCLKYAFPEGGGNLWIRAYGKDENLFFEVQDDGVGFEVPPDILSIKEEGTGGYGLVNVNERIKLQYGEDCGLTVISSDGNGVNVIVKIKNTTNEE
jgi:two-component system sensor histidine kinase YesM